LTHVDTVTLISSNTDLFREVSEALSAGGATPYRGILLKDPAAALDFLSMEMPDLALVDCSDPSFDAFDLLKSITIDPWLFHGGIIALCENFEISGKLEDVKGANIVAIVMREDVQKHLPTIIAVVAGNRRLLYQQELGADLVRNISGSFRLGSDPIEAACYANLVSNFLCSSGRIAVDDKSVLTMSIFEMLINAIEHGNCGIGYAEKTAWLEQGKNIGDLIERKCRDPVVAAKRVTFDYTFMQEQAHFSIADEGEGFDWQKFTDSTHATGALELHGRGIFMTKGFTRNMRYNESGNEVSFEIEYSRERSVVTPGVLGAMETTDVEAGQTVFTYGEPSDYLYYIVKGTYEIIVNDRTVSVLSPDDIFMGEMSFLLNNKRSATVRAATAGRLIRISKKDFVEAVRRKPPYALFLSRLLAQRIQRLNERELTAS
jgi:hypothetical protein